MTVDAGAGTELPLFLVGERPAAGAGEAVQVLPHQLKGRLCLTCGHLSAQARLTRQEVEDYRAKLKQTTPATLADRRPISPRGPTWVKRSKGEG